MCPHQRFSVEKFSSRYGRPDGFARGAPHVDIVKNLDLRSHKMKDIGLDALAPLCGAQSDRPLRLRYLASPGTGITDPFPSGIAFGSSSKFCSTTGAAPALLDSCVIAPVSAKQSPVL